MGDRGNIAITQGTDPQEFVVLYGHWSGSELPELLRKAIARRQRWDDSQYFARIVFDAMTKGEYGNETGFGISTRIQDNSYPVLIADVDTQQVYTADEEDLAVPTSHKFSFKEFAALEKADWETFN